MNLWRSSPIPYAPVDMVIATPAEKIRSRLRVSHLVLAILLLAALVRFQRLDAQSLWYDEGFSIAVAKAPLREAISWVAQDVHPPLYYLLLKVWIRLCGASAFSVRMSSVLASVIATALLYTLGTALHGPGAGLLSAFFMALSPLYVYYAQEARTYSLLAAVALAATYTLWRLTDGIARGPRRSVLWLAFIGLELVGAYLHYFYLLLLPFHALYLAWRWWELGRPWSLAREALVALIAGVAGYAPWAPVMLERYAHDTGYLPGSMAPTAAARIILRSLSAGPVLDGSPARWITLGHLAALAIGGLALLLTVRPRKRTWSRHPLIFLGLYLAIPMALTIIIYHLKARVNPHHTIAMAPAFLGLLATGIVALWDLAGRLRRTLGTFILRNLAWGTVAFLASMAVYANRQYQTDIRYQRADFRAALRFVCSEVTPQDVVFLVSGHMFPIFDYYCPGVQRYLFPDTPVLQVDQQVGLEIIETLQEATLGKKRVWVVLWQNYFVDPHDVVGTLLAEQAQEPPKEFWFNKIWVRNYVLRPDAHFAWEDKVPLQANARWEKGIALVEARANRTVFKRGEHLQLTLYWRTDQPIAESYAVFTHLIDGREVVLSQHDSIPAGGKRPTNSWQPGELIVDRHRITVLEVIPPGEYRLEVGLYRPDLRDMPRLKRVDSPPGEELRLILGTVRVE